MKVAVVGTGIAGMVAADMLHRTHELTVYEAGDYVGGHTHTVDVETPDGMRAIDTGFIVFNERTYPNLVRLFRRLGVAWKESEMSFSVRNEGTGLEYNGTSLDRLFVQRSNVLRPSFWRMVRDILRFYREAPRTLALDGDGPTLGDYLRDGGYSRSFVEDHLVPMGAAVWSARPDRMLEMPLSFLVRFFQNHGFLQAEGRPQWLVVDGGSREYVEKLTAPWRDRIRLRSPIVRVTRGAGGVLVRTASGDEQRFDRVVLASHSDQSLRMLADPSPLEREILGAIPYQRNEAVLHTDRSLMPRRRRAWASWNYHIGDPPSDLPTVTYWMNKLQGFRAREEYFVTLNRTGEIDSERVLGSFVYHHPVFTPAAVKAQARHAEIDGVGGVHFCGAYWGWGFHEDGVKSVMAMAERFGMERAA